MTSFASKPESEAPRLQPWAILLGSLAIVAVFVVTERGVRSIGHLEEASYFYPSIAAGVLERLIGLPGIISVVLIAALAVGRRTHERVAATVRLWMGPWEDWEYGAALRVVIGIAAGIIAWALVSYAHNPYFGQNYTVDRLLLGCGLVAVLWRPAAIVPFCILAVAFIGQLDYPVADFPWTEVHLPLRVLFLFVAAHLVGSVRQERDMNTFVLVLCCLIAINYWWSGLGKWDLGWIAHRHLNLLILGAYANGWMQAFEPETVVRLSERLSPLNTPLMLFTLVVEWGALLLLFRRWTLVGFLCCAAAFHTGIFAFTGMLFWKWIVVEAALLWFLLSERRIHSLRIFTPTHLATSVVLILGCNFWVEARDLSWYDTPLTYTVRLTGVGVSGAEYALPTRYTGPYSDMFFLAPFRYATADPQLTSVMGAAGPPHALADSLRDAGSVQAVLAIEHRQPPTPMDPEKTKRFDALVARIAGDLNENGVPGNHWTRLLRAPRHLWNSARRSERVFASQEPLDHVNVDVVLSYYDGTTVSDIERRTVRTVPAAGR